MTDDFNASFMDQARAYWRIGAELPLDLHEQLALQGIIVNEAHEQYLTETKQGVNDGI